MRFAIDGEGANTTFTVDERTGDVFVTKTLDREKQALYTLSAMIFDGNNMLIEKPEDFDIQVTDINDNTPVFSGKFNGSIMERSTRGKQGYSWNNYW